MILRTPRLRLVTIEPRHVASLRELWTNPLVMANVGFPDGLAPEDLHLERYVSKDSDTSSAAAPERGSEITPPGRARGVHMAVEDEHGIFIGEAKLGAPGNSGICEPDVKLLPRWWRQGYGEEIVRALVTESFARWPECRCLRLTPNVDNHAAQALYRRVGARVVGEGHHPPGATMLRGFVGVRFHILEIERPAP